MAESCRPARVDATIRVTDDEAVEAARLLARTEDIFAGYACGTNITAALRPTKTNYCDRIYTIQGLTMSAPICTADPAPNIERFRIRDVTQTAEFADRLRCS